MLHIAAIISLLLEDDEDLKDLGHGAMTPAEARAYELRNAILAGKVRESQYTQSYLEGNRDRGEGHGLTIGSYLSYVLRGKAKDYAGHYGRALQNALDRRVAVGLAKDGTSHGGGTAYYPVDP